MKCLTVFLSFFTAVLSQKCCNIGISSGAGTSSAPSPFTNASVSAFTACAWAKANKQDPYYILSLVSPKLESVLVITTEKVSIRDKEVSSYSGSMGTTYAHLCVTWHTAAGARVYFNGSEIDNQSTTLGVEQQPLNLSGTWYTGHKMLAVNKSITYSTDQALEGWLCGTTVWSGVLDGEAIAKLYTDSTSEAEEGEAAVEGSSGIQYNSGNETSVVLSWPDFTHTGYDLIDTQYCEEEEAHGIKLGNLDPVASKFVILFLVIIGVIIGFGALFLCSERELANKRASKKKKQDQNHISLDEGSIT